jgi:hypothetical protein
VTPAVELGFKRIRKLAQALRAKPGIAVRLPHDFDPSFIADFGDEGAKEARAASFRREGTLHQQRP